MYKKCYQGRKLGTNIWEMHLWESDDIHQKIPFENFAYVEDDENYTHKGLKGENLKPTLDWFYTRGKNSHKNTPRLHFHDMKYHQKFLIERYGTNDEPSTGHKEIFFDIECEMGGALK